jgi:hypothetical protein
MRLARYIASHHAEVSKNVGPHSEPELGETKNEDGDEAEPSVLHH